MYHPAWNTIFKRQAPKVTLMDVRETTDALTTYTFTACNLGDIGTTKTPSDDAYGTNPHLRSPGRKMIVVIAHGDDAATTFGISSITIGGVAGVEQIDRGGGTNAINTALYSWNTESLQNITNTDVVVTWTETTNNCAIGVLLAENLGLLDFVGSASGTSTSAFTMTISAAIAAFDMQALLIGGSSEITNGEQTFAVSSNGKGGIQPEILYAQRNAEINFAGFWAYSPQYNADEAPFAASVSWTGAAARDGVLAAFV